VVDCWQGSLGELQPSPIDVIVAEECCCYYYLFLVMANGDVVFVVDVDVVDGMGRWELASLLDPVFAPCLSAHSHRVACYLHDYWRIQLERIEASLMMDDCRPCRDDCHSNHQ